MITILSWDFSELYIVEIDISINSINDENA